MSGRHTESNGYCGTESLHLFTTGCFAFVYVSWAGGGVGASQKQAHKAFFWRPYYPYATLVTFSADVGRALGYVKKLLRTLHRHNFFD
jgi:hypothetical protein